MKRFNFPLLTFATVLFFSCSSDDDNTTTPIQVVVENEVITTVELAITDSEAGTTETISWKEGVNDNATKRPEIALAANKSYTTAIKFLNESNPNSVDNITDEVKKDKDEHYVFYTPENTLTGFTLASNPASDTIDSNDIGINIETTWTTGDASTGTLTAFLIHEPTTKSGTARSDFGGSTDIEVTFNITVE